jgi:cell division transport system permease protein
LRKLVWLAGLALAATVILLIHYSLRSEIIKRREEIQVVKLVGGSPAFVQRPFIYFAVMLGFVGAVLALLAVKLVSMTMMPMIEELSALYGKTFNLAITADFSFSVIALAIILSVAAALLTIRSLLKHMELDRS